MTPRFDLQGTLGDGYAKVMGLERHVRARVDRTLLELVKLRASMTNGCAFCVDMHGTDALAHGEPARRLLALAAWQESPSFDATERAVLALTDAVTAVDHGALDGAWAGAEAALGAEAAADVLLAIATINVWNRLAITAGTRPPALEAA